MINLRRLERLKIQVNQKDLGPDPTSPSHHQPTIGAPRASRCASTGCAIYLNPRLSAGCVVSWCKGGAARPHRAHNSSRVVHRLRLAAGRQAAARAGGRQGAPEGGSNAPTHSGNPLRFLTQSSPESHLKPTTRPYRAIQAPPVPLTARSRAFP